MKHQLLFVIPWMNIGGADSFNLALLRQLHARGWDATVVTTLPSAHPWRPLFAAVADRLVDLAAHPSEEAPARLLAAAQASGADTLLISNSTLGYRLLPYLRAHLPHLPVVDYNHAYSAWRDGGYPRLSLQYAPHLDRQIVASHNLRQWMLDRDGDPTRVAVCPINVDTNTWRPDSVARADTRAALQIPEHAPVVLYAARLEREKQPALAAAVMRAVAAQVGDVVFLVAGAGQYSGFLRSFVRAHRLERHVRLLGAVDAGRMRELLAASDVLFLPSQMEGISMAIYEAMAMGVVPLAAAVGGQPELVAPECGVLVARGPSERADYERALLRLLNNPASLRHMAAAARARVERHFPLPRMGERMDALLREAHLAHTASPNPLVSSAAALASAEQAIVAARADLAEVAPARGSRSQLRAAYWRLVDAGAWQLVPLLERARTLRS